MIHDSLKEMRRLGARLIEIERLRHQMRKGNAPREAFQQIDRRHHIEIAYGKMMRTNLILGVFVAFILVVAGIFNGVIALTHIRIDGHVSPSGIVNTLCSIVLLCLGKRQVIG
ncbi:MAG: hypothetical protein WCO26_11430 [Deltaproteobacteria bacterium]